MLLTGDPAIPAIPAKATTAAIAGLPSFAHPA